MSLKKANKSKPFEIPAYMEPREPKPLSPFAAFYASLEDEVPYLEALKEFQDVWCTHPAAKEEVLSIHAEPVAEKFDYTVTCILCGREKLKKGRPSKRVQ